ncbi:MAG: glucosamine-6-phosphate deaminase [Vicinamibacterales bacterium]
MEIRTYADRLTMSQAAASHAADRLREILAGAGAARIIAATGASQLAFLEALTSAPTIDWSQVELFHLDEYIGLPIDHPASFRRYLLDRLIAPAGITRHHLIDAERDPARAAAQAGDELRRAPIDVAFVGIGENGHLAFNDPPADFETDEPYLIVSLDEACRRQQVGEGWFASLADVPIAAVSMSIRQILAAREILCIVPDERKAVAVQAACEGAVTSGVPASILQQHPRTTLYLDAASASRLHPATRGEVRAGARG